MKIRCMLNNLPTSFIVTILTLTIILIAPAAAQNPELQQKVAEVKQATAENKQALAHYSWQQQETIAIKGDVKDIKCIKNSKGADLILVGINDEPMQIFTRR